MSWSTATGTFRLETEQGARVFERPVELGSVIPTLETVVLVHSPQDPPPGKYVARLVLTQKDGQEVRRDSNVTIPEAKVNGCKTQDTIRQSDQGKDDNFGAQPAGGDAAARDGGGDSPSSWLLFALVAALFAMAWGLVFVLWRNRQRRGRSGPGASA